MFMVEVLLNLSLTSPLGNEGANVNTRGSIEANKRKFKDKFKVSTKQQKKTYNATW